MAVAPSPSPTAAPAAEKSRLHGLDRLKACAIVTVLWIHGFQAWDVSKSLAMQWSSVICTWSVPAFFVASGWLHARRTPYPPGTVARWLKRIAVPYVIATIIITLWDRYVIGYYVPFAGLPLDLLLGRGIYYFVPVLLMCLLVTMPLAGRPRAAWLAWGLMAPFMFISARFDPLIWLTHGGFQVMLRSPFHWAPFFVTGWVCALTSPAARARLRPAVSWLAPVVWMTLTLLLCRRFATALLIYWPDWAHAARGVMVLTGIATFVAWSDRPTGTIVRWLSAATLPLYLYHIAFVNLFDTVLRPQTSLQYVQRTVLASAITVVLVLALRRLLGAERARALIG